MARRLSAKQKLILNWMKEGDRCLHRQGSDTTRYGFYENRKFVFLCSRQTVDALVASGEVEWLNDCPPDQRAMIPIAQVQEPQ